jgi:hypothetical protein
MTEALVNPDPVRRVLALSSTGASRYQELRHGSLPGDRVSRYQRVVMSVGTRNLNDYIVLRELQESHHPA